MKKNLIYNIIILIFASIFFISTFFLLQNILNNQKHKGKFDALANIVEEVKKSEPTDSTTGTAAPYDPYVAVANPENSEMLKILPEYAELYKINSDIVGWMRIDGTKINYPVMQTPDEPDYYLHRDFEKEYSSHGCLYVREACDVNKPSDNLTIYGHHMNDGSMMAVLKEYKNESFWKEHPTIVFDTLFEHNTYEIFAVFVTSAIKGKGFAYHTFVDETDPAKYDEFILKCKDLSFYETGITPQYGDKLITLSTCDYSISNGRLVVVCRQILGQ